MNVIARNLKFQVQKELKLHRQIFTSSSVLFKTRKIKFSSDYCTSKKEVRVRFAPSPTGYIHLGGLRTALFNYLFAKANNGKFILRIEDTDQSRLVDGATEQIMNDLQWAGMKIDEGPFIGGDFGPYIQSERLDIYKSHVKKLLESDNAYHCFCTERRLELLRKEALKNRQTPKYDNRCRHLTPGQIAEKIAKGDKYCIRFKLNDRGESFNDLVYGKFVYYVAQHEGDPVILKADKFPTYHLANVVDDHLMEVTHVLRGLEWQISTPKHLMMYRAFGWTPPAFGHLPLIMNADGSKLSKRQSDIKLEYYRERGYFPQTLLNYITQAGGGFKRESEESLQFYDMQQLTDKFDIDRINSNSTRLNPDLLKDLNQLELVAKIENAKECKILIEKVRELVKAKYPLSADQLDLDDDHIFSVLKWASKRIHTINELAEEELSFLWVLPKLTRDNQIELNEGELNYV
jgi:glutamyl-tRNA synthetase